MNLAFPILLLPILGGVIVYLVFMFKNRWYGQTVMAVAVVGGVVASILGVHKLTARGGREWLGAVLLLGGLLILVTAAVAIGKAFPRGKGSQKTPES